MEQKNKITSLQELFDWIEKSSRCFISENGNDFFRINTPLNTDVFIDIEKDDEIDDIVKKTIESLQDFDADERFEELWESGFVSQNHFRPSQFIKMLQEDEETFRELAGEIEKNIKSD